MGSSLEAADSIRIAVQSISTCTPSVATTLTNLLLPKSEKQNTTATTKKKATKYVSGKGSSLGMPAARSRSHGTTKTEHQDDYLQLSAKERSILATETINATLKLLSGAIKAHTSAQPRSTPPKRTAKASSRGMLRRSSSAPQSPLQPRSLNRVASSPNISSKGIRSSPKPASNNHSYRGAAMCARTALAGLRDLQATKSSGIELPPLQLENGMSVLIGKLISLGLDDLATKELRVLKRRLETDISRVASGPSSRNVTSSTTTDLSDLLNFGKIDYNGEKLGLLITTQLQVLRLMATFGNPEDIESALEVVRVDHQSSPTRLLLMAAKDSGQAKLTDKLVRQMQNLSEILLSLCPGVSTPDDALALEHKISVSPQIAIQLQTIALHNRFLWWGLASHNGDLAKDIFDPFLRCLLAFARRSQITARETYEIAANAMQDLGKLVSDCSDSHPRALRTVLAGTYRLMGSLAREAQELEVAITFTQQIQILLSPEVDSDAKRFSVLARLVSLRLQTMGRGALDEELLLSLLDGLQQPFRGDSTDVDELMMEVSNARKAAINLLAKNPESIGGSSPKLADGIRQMCESLVFICPRLSLRYIGNAPDTDSALTKEMIRYEQRRQYIAKMSVFAIDSAMFLLKMLSSNKGLAWDSLDSRLQDCLILLGRLRLDSQEILGEATAVSSYYVRISNLYFTHYLNTRIDPDNAKHSQQIRALRRSTQCIQGRPKTERRSAQYVMKLERLAEMCKDIGRYDELFKTLSTIRDELVDDGVLAAVVECASSQPLNTAFNHSRDATILGRLFQSLVKVQLRYVHTASQIALLQDSWSDETKGLVLEQQLQSLCNQLPETSLVLKVKVRIFNELMAVYSRQHFPLRRVRVLLSLVSSDVNKQHEILAQARSELENSHVQQLQVQDTRDGGLSSYLAHYKCLTSTIMELQKCPPQIHVLKQSVYTWSSIRRKCDNLLSFYAQVDDVPNLLVHLRAIAEWLQIKGFDDARITVLQLIVDINLIHDKGHPDDLVLSQIQLGDQWNYLGYSGKAGLALDKAKTYSSENGISVHTIVHLHLSYCQYLLSIGHVDKVEEHLACAHALYNQESDHPPQTRKTSMLEHKTKILLLLSRACQVSSSLALERGSAHMALVYARQSVRHLRKAWAHAEKCTQQARGEEEVLEVTAIDRFVGEFSEMTVNDSRLSTESTEAVISVQVWAIILPLFCSLNHLSNLFAHHGMFQETLYYAEQAHKIGQQVDSEGLLAISTTILGTTWLQGEDLEKSSRYLTQAQRLSEDLPQNKERTLLVVRRAELHRRLGDWKAEMAAYDSAEHILDGLTRHEEIGQIGNLSEPDSTLIPQISKLSLSKRKAAPPRKTAGRLRAATKTRGLTQAKSHTQLVQLLSAECPQLLALKYSISRQKARVLMCLKQYEEAALLLQGAAEMSDTPLGTFEHSLAMAEHLLLYSLEQMSSDPVYSVLQDSTISYPSVIGTAKVPSGRLSGSKTSSPRKRTAAKGSLDRSLSKSPVADSFFDKLRQAQEHAASAHATALAIGSVSMIHNTSSLLNSTTILLSAAGQVRGKAFIQPGLASTSIEIARNIAFHRERGTLQVDIRMDDLCWPSIQSLNHRSGVAPPCEMAQFQADYIDIIPKSWNVISISLDNDHTELSINKLQAGHSPFVLRLPLSRNNSIDADEEMFGFDQGLAELREIIELANATAHDAKGREGREAKIEWWEERESLDMRLRDLLHNIEKVWLGGFIGIFSQHSRQPALLARFQKSFQNILDKHLPSRQKSKRRIINPKITLDPRILELFVGLGDASKEDADLTDPLTDLLYFVVDILQFHGELNAYAEIDFDSVVVEMMDALRSYHTAVQSSERICEDRHIILILDKALHSFPWESLPCMDGLAVSRLPSLACLRDRILTQDNQVTDTIAAGHYIDRTKGSYILNPGGDLKHTQTTFQKNLRNLSGWQGLTNQEPSEQVFRSYLEDKDLVLYFGHGSGAQYIRSREIKRLRSCAVAVLMGCSSGNLINAGEFEPYGPPMNYMHAGSHALVATLWDVTDKDIDRFAKTTFEHWGLWEADTIGHQRAAESDKQEVNGRMSLVQAVARSRSVCKLRYLNAASVCVYGVPVYFK